MKYKAKKLGLRFTRQKIITCSRLLKTGCNNVVLPTLFIVVNNIVQHCWAWISPRSGVTMLNNIVDNYEQYRQHNIVASCFQQPWTSDNFLPCSFSSKKVMVGYKFSYTTHCMKFKAKKLKTICWQSKCAPPRPNISHNTEIDSFGAILLLLFNHHTRFKIPLTIFPLIILWLLVIFRTLNLLFVNNQSHSTTYFIIARLSIRKPESSSVLI